MDHFGRRERVQLERGIPAFDGTKQIFVPRERQVRVVPALHQQLHAADRDRFIDLAEQLVEAEDVAFRRSDGPIERAEVAPGHADVRVVDVAIDDVGDDPVRMFPRAQAVGKLSEQRCRRAAIQLERLVC